MLEISDFFVNELRGRIVFPVNEQIPPVQSGACCGSYSEAAQPHPPI